MTFLNVLRADVFDVLTATLAKGGAVTDVEAKAIASFVNEATGRGKIGVEGVAGLGDQGAVGLNTIFFAPRYVASRFNMITGRPIWQMSGGTARTRALVAGEYAKFAIGMAAIYALASMFGGDIERDPKSSDFGKIRIGNTRIDPLAGMSQATVFLSRVISGKTTTLKGETVPIRGEGKRYGGQSTGTVIGRFTRSKFAPHVGAAYNFVTGEDYLGNKMTLAKTVSDVFSPLAINDVYDALREHGLPEGAALGLLAILGVGLQVHDNPTEAPKKTKGKSSDTSDFDAPITF